MGYSYASTSSLCHNGLQWGDIYIFLFVCGLFKKSFSVSDNVAASDGMFNEMERM